MAEILGRRPEDIAHIFFKKGVTPAVERLNKGLEKIVFTPTARAERETLRETGIFPADPAQKLLLEKMVRCYCDIHVHGFENIQEMQGILYRKGGTLSIAPCHEGHADGGVEEVILRDLGFDPAFVLGKRILDNGPVDFMGRGVDCVHVWPPTDIPETEEEIRKMATMNSLAARGAITIFKEKRPLVVFLEGGRTRTGTLKDDVFESVAGYFTLGKGDHYVVPVAIEGSDKVLPVHANWPVKGRVDITIGKPFNVEEKMADVEKNGNRIKWKETLFVRTMREIAMLRPKEKRGVYAGPVKVILKEENGRMVKKAVSLAA